MTDKVTTYNLSIENLSKIFGKRLIIKNLNKHLDASGIYGISGSNGTGKSTLVKIIAGLLVPSKGKVIHRIGDKVIPTDGLQNYIGFSSPYLVLYDEFSAQENIEYLMKIRGIVLDKQYLDILFKKVNLFDRRHDIIRTYSSGMKQRLRLIFALIHKPELVILDEPTSNLDEAGKEICYELIRDIALNKIIIVASNEVTDLALCSEIIQMEDYKK